MNKTVSRVILAFTTLSLLAGCANNRGERRERPELSPERKAEMYERFVRRWDLNADNQVTCLDVTLQRRALFSVLDKNYDEQLAPNEYRFAKFEDKSFLFYLFTEVDKDTSGAVSLRELDSVTHSEFASLDKDGDCVISELEAEVDSRNRARDRRDGPNGRERGGRGDRESRPPRN